MSSRGVDYYPSDRKSMKKTLGLRRARPTKYVDIGVRGRKTGWQPKANIKVDDDGYDNVEDFFASENEQEEEEEEFLFENSRNFRDYQDRKILHDLNEPQSNMNRRSSVKSLKSRKSSVIPIDQSDFVEDYAHRRSSSRYSRDEPIYVKRDYGRSKSLGRYIIQEEESPYRRRSSSAGRYVLTPRHYYEDYRGAKSEPRRRYYDDFGISEEEEEEEVLAYERRRYEEALENRRRSRSLDVPVYCSPILPRRKSGLVGLDERRRSIILAENRSSPHNSPYYSKQLLDFRARRQQQAIEEEEYPVIQPFKQKHRSSVTTFPDNIPSDLEEFKAKNRQLYGNLSEVDEDAKSGRYSSRKRSIETDRSREFDEVKSSRKSRKSLKSPIFKQSSSPVFESPRLTKSRKSLAPRMSSPEQSPVLEAQKSSRKKSIAHKMHSPLKPSSPVFESNNSTRSRKSLVNRGLSPELSMENDQNYAVDNFRFDDVEPEADFNVPDGELSDGQKSGVNEEEEEEELVLKKKKEKAKKSEKAQTKKTRNVAEPTIKRSKPKAQVIPLAPPEIHEEGVRRSHRTRITPLNWWDGETAVYKPSRADGCVVGLPVLSSVIRVDEEEEQVYRKSKKKSKKRQDLENQENYNPIADDGKKQLTINVKNLETGEMEERELIIAQSMINWMETTTNCEYGKTQEFKQTATVSTGFIALKPGAEKPNKNTKKNTLSFVVVVGKVQVQINDSSVVVGVGTQFSVPCGNQYRLVNTGKTECRLFWVSLSPEEN